MPKLRGVESFLSTSGEEVFNRCECYISCSYDHMQPHHEPLL